MHIIKSTDAILVEHPVTLIFGQPGIGKSTLGYSAKDPLLLDLDQGAHRAANRRDTLKVTTWADVAELAESRAALEPYATVVVDTVGRLLDLIAADIIEANPKNARDGALTLQGYGVLKTRFRTWLTQIRTWGKDVVLLAHHREEKDGDLTILRPDIIGASYGEVHQERGLRRVPGDGRQAARARLLAHRPLGREEPGAVEAGHDSARGEGHHGAGRADRQGPRGARHDFAGERGRDRRGRGGQGADCRRARPRRTARGCWRRLPAGAAGGQGAGQARVVGQRQGAAVDV